MSRKLSATMAFALAEGLERGGILVRWRGGWWTYPGCAVKEVSKGHRVPEWSVMAGTIKALRERGHAEVHGIDTSGMVSSVRLILEPGK